MKTSQYTHLNALRAIAAFLVLGYHFIVISEAHNSWLATHLPVFNIGWIGVDLFLLISGFVITHSAIRANYLQDSLSQNYYISRRIKRIVPLYLLTCILWIIFINNVALEGSWRHVFFQILTHLFFIHDYFPSTAGSINGVTWTIALEVQFYVLMYFVVRFLKPHNPWYAFFVCLLVAWIARGLVVWAMPYNPANEIIMSIRAGHLPAAMDRFGCGIVLALFFNKYPNHFLLHRKWLTFLGSMIIFLLIFSGVCILLDNVAYWSTPFMVIFLRTLLAISFIFLIIGFMNIPKMFDVCMRPLNYLGTISYGIYLWHLGILELLLRYTNIRGMALCLLLCLITCVISAISWHFFESPLMNTSWRSKQWFNIPVVRNIWQNKEQKDPF